jgi:hypothetical protein
MIRRREFPSPVKRAAYERSGGICECHRIPHVFSVACGCPLGEGNTFYEHIVEAALGGDATLDNCAVLTRTCWRFKTARNDQPRVAQAKRMQDRARGIRPKPFRPLPGSRHSPVKISMWRGPVDRRTGEPWRWS